MRFQAVQEGHIEQDETILREIQKLCLKLSSFDAKEGIESNQLVNLNEK